MRTRLVQIFCLASGLLLCGALIAEMLLYSQNTLLNNGNWIVTKRKLPMAVMGADEFLITRSPLAGNYLDLGSWYGHQEVLLKNGSDLSELQFKFNIPDSSYLDIILGKSSEGFSGIRISRAEAFPSIFFTSDPEGRFLSQRPTSLNKIEAGWHKAKFSALGAAISLSVSGQPSVQIDSRATTNGAAGFRAGLAGASVDDVVVKFANGSSLRDSFRNESGWLTLTALHFGFLVLVFALAILLLINLRRWRVASVLNGSLVVAAQMVVCLGLFHAFDYFYWSKIPFHSGMRLLSTGRAVPQIAFETYREKLFKSWATLSSKGRNIREEISAEYPRERINQGPIFCGAAGDECALSKDQPIGSLQKRCARFLLVGTSQSIGSSANSLEQSFFARLHRGLRSSLAGSCVESLNISVSGSTLAEMTNLFEKHVGFQPDIVVLNISNNDSEVGFDEGLRHFVAVCQKIHSRVIFVAEPNSRERGYLSHLSVKHEAMKLVGAEAGVQTISLQDYLGRDSVMNGGYIWWDYVHLTSYGQALVADWLLPKILDAIRDGNSVARGGSMGHQTRQLAARPF